MNKIEFVANGLDTVMEKMPNGDVETTYTFDEREVTTQINGKTLDIGIQKEMKQVQIIKSDNIKPLVESMKEQVLSLKSMISQSEDLMKSLDKVKDLDLAETIKSFPFDKMTKHNKKVDNINRLVGEWSQYQDAKAKLENNTQFIEDLQKQIDFLSN